MVKAVVGGDRKDAGDARGIYVAAQELEVKTVATKTEA